MTIKKCVLVVGHRKGSPGAVNEATGKTEFGFNNDLAEYIKQVQTVCDVEVVLRSTYQRLPGKINALRPDFIISLHCNAFNKKASGTETLYHHNSNKGLLLAGIMQRNVVEVLGLPDRGVKAKRVEDRGGYLLKNTNAPCVILEPGFIDNDNDLERMTDKLHDLANAIIEGMAKFARIV